MRGLILAAREREKETESIPKGGWAAESETREKRVPTLRACASYERAMALAKKLAASDDPKELLELHDLLADDPMKDLDGEGFRVIFEEVRSRIVEKFRQSAYKRGGWGFG